MNKILKRNQVVIYVIAIMVMAAGYLNYTTKQEDNSLETSMQLEAKDETSLADIGNATLVSSNDIIGGNITEENTATNSENQLAETSTDNTENKEKNEEAKETASETSDEYFIKSKLERDQMYSQMLETYEKVLNSSNALETQKQAVTQEITKINDTKNSIMICENLIKTKGFENSVVFVNGDSISVIIEAKELQQEEVAQIQNIISREMKAEIENIHIATK